MSLSEMHTCVTCRVIFKDNDMQREHYKSDWHRYNLKRKIAQLPSVTAEEFNNRVLQQRSKIEGSSQSTAKYCESCRKSFGNEKSYNNHLNSKKHADNLLNNCKRSIDTTVQEKEEENVKMVKHESVKEDAMSDDSDVEEVDSDEWDEDAPVTECIFCDHHSRSLVRNLRHMTSEHSFFIPDVEYCIDIPGLLSYLGAKVHQGHMCLWCSESGRTFHTSEAAQAHMSDKGHCKMLFEGAALTEYTDFYDYSTSYPDDTKENPEDEVDIEQLDGSDFQLVLPSGAVIGHRSLFRYYKQRFSTQSALVATNNEIRAGPKVSKLLAHYRSSGWAVAQPEQVRKRARDVQYVQKLQRKWEMKLGIKANKLQKHFRPQVNF